MNVSYFFTGFRFQFHFSHTFFSVLTRWVHGVDFSGTCVYILLVEAKKSKYKESNEKNKRKSGEKELKKC